MLRKLALSLAIAGALGVTQANALGLGEITVRSALNEPLNAEIRLLQVRDLSPLQIQPRMASVDDFSLAGVSRSRFVNDMRFQVSVRPDGTGVIRVTSNEPIREPFLNFLMEVNWPSGRLVREYTVLLDPPVFDPAPMRQAVMPAVAPQVTPVAPVAPVVARPAAVATPPVSNVRTRVDSGSEIYIDSRDTLWNLALRHRPDASVPPQQMMLALLRKNPQSFPTGNINMMKAGTVMQRPTLEEIRQLNAQQANAEVARQTELWRQGRGRTPVAASASTPASAPSATTPVPVTDPSAPATPAVDAALKIVTPPEAPEADVADAEVAEPSPADITPSEVSDEAVLTDEASALSTDLAEGLLQRSEEIDNRLAITQEVVDKIERENRDLNEKLDSIQEQLALMQRMLELKDQELAAIQTQPQTPDSAASSLLESLKSLPVVGGLAGALIAALAALVLARRKREPKEKAPMFTAPENLKPQSASDHLPEAAVAAAAVSAAAVAQADEGATAEEASTPQVEEPALSNDDFVDDFSDLDLDMDLDLTEEPVADDSVRVMDEEFDLSSEEDLDVLMAAQDLQDLEGGEDWAAADQPATAEVTEEVASAPETEEVEDLLADLDFDEVLTQTPAAEEDDLLSSLEQDLMADLPEELEEASSWVDQADDLRLDTEAELTEVLEPEAVTPAEAPVKVPAAAEVDVAEEEGLDFSLEDLLSPAAEAEAEANETASTSELESSLLDADELDFVLNEMSAEPEQEASVASAAPEVEDKVDEEVDAFGELDFTLSEPAEQVSLETEKTSADLDLDAELESLSFTSEPSAEVVEEVVEDELLADDLDALFSAGIELEEEVLETAASASETASVTSPGARVEEELTANIMHDLEMGLEDELDDLLGSTDDEIALEDTGAESDEDLDLLDSLNMLDGADEIETKLDLARAYMDMDDQEGAKEILKEIVRDGNEAQRMEADKLLRDLG
ncbi:FimV/HubP family polar landmark protein [Nitrincola tapanii]|uniref:FimV N-terminal domain-containing protein n=1 Tax=Nitrincola tapanii TaxID=1708751 RepID=A0A5A9W5X8_9GAMM|nr:FimV/HubP family polar landmark protein [Nitrincola tapanii]KAA0875854.1 hypothetical protein E1H14_03990 [Nitrincola tapanii]